MWLGLGAFPKKAQNNPNEMMLKKGKKSEFPLIFG